jgi:hypothetical protein
MSTPEQPTATDPAAPATTPARAARGAARSAPAADDAAQPEGPAGAETAPVESPAAAASDPQGGPDDPTEGAPEKRRRGRPKGSTARTTRTIELMLTVSGTVDGEWQAELKQGSTWLSRGLPVSAGAVAKAARELHAELADPIDAAIGAAREQRAARVAALEAELEQARKALAEMDG